MLSLDEKRIVDQAIEILDAHARNRMLSFKVESPEMLRRYLRLKLESEEHEVFCVVWLTQTHRVIAFERLFHGSINGCNVYLRQLVKRALHFNAAAMIAVHNHPSGHSEPSQSDIFLTGKIQEALALIDVRLVDHVVVGKGELTSFAEKGMM